MQKPKAPIERHETAIQSSGPEFVFTDLGSFGRRRRAHQIWFHLSAPWWKVIRGGSDLEQREISTSLRRRFVCIRRIGAAGQHPRQRYFRIR
ncbi:unnamed protein product [Brassica oleracea var. botrytis]